MDGLLTGHTLLADWFWLIAAILFVVDAVLVATERTTPRVLVPFALALVAAGLLVL